jgi:hypothetical protein
VDTTDGCVFPTDLYQEEHNQTHPHLPYHPFNVADTEGEDLTDLGYPTPNNNFTQLHLWKIMAAQQQPDHTTLLTQLLTVGTQTQMQIVQTSANLQSLTAAQTTNAQAIADLSQELKVMATALQAVVNNQKAPSITITTHVVEKPECYKGEVSPQACRFLSHFTLWAANTGNLLNVLDTTNNTWVPAQDKWITTALSYMAGDAGVWAQPYINHFTSGKGAPFGGDFLKFHNAFNNCFDPLSEKQQAIEALSVLIQGKDTVVVYTSRFKEITNCMGFSNPNLLQCYCMGLLKKIKSAIAISDCKQDTYQDLQETPVLLDNHICNVEFEDALQSGKCIPSGHNPLVDSVLH